MTSTLETIVNLSPGLYEMVIEDYEGPIEDRRFTVSFHERKMDDLRTIDDGIEDKAPFAGVARMSEQVGKLYDVTMRPFVKAMGTEGGAEMMRKLHPSRTQRSTFASQKPIVAPLKDMPAEKVRIDRKPVASDNPFFQMQHIWVDGVQQSMDMMRDMRDMMYETTFFALWGARPSKWCNSPDDPRSRSGGLDA